MSPQVPGSSVAVRCPATACGLAFDVPPERLGRNTYCPFCGVRLTARPARLEADLEHRMRTAAGAPGASIERLPLAVVVDNVRSLWNVGSIFRTADACGVAHVALTGISGCPPRPQIAKTALGAEQAVAWSYEARVERAIERLVDEGYVPVAIEATERAVPLDAFVWPQRVGLVIGNEVAGIAPAVLEACAHHVAIPMLGVKESLNVAVAFGIVAHACASELQRRAVAPTRATS